MSKRRYHSIELKRVDRQKVQEGIVGARVVFAVDVAKEKSVATLQDHGDPAARHLPLGRLQGQLYSLSRFVDIQPRNVDLQVGALIAGAEVSDVFLDLSQVEALLCGR